MRKILIVTYILAVLWACDTAVSTQPGHLMTPSVSPTELPKKNNPQAERHLNQGLKYKAAGDYDKAIEEFKKSIEAGNDDKEMFRRIAELYLAQERYSDAEENLKKILDKDPEDAMAHWQRAKILVEQLENYEDGLKEAILAKKLYGDDGSSYVHDRIIARAYDGLGDYESAIKHYRVFLSGISYSPSSREYKEVANRVAELEKLVGSRKRKRT